MPRQRSKGKSPKRKIDPQRMIDTAVAFFLAGERCTPAMSFGVYGHHSVGAPVVVNYAFAIEVTLKLIHRAVTRKRPPKEHNLAKLFEALDEPTKLKIGQFYPNRTCSDQMRNVLAAYQKAFVTWRYAYESRQLLASTQDLRRAFIGCHAALRQFEPDLVSIYERNWGAFKPDPDWAWYEPEERELSSAYERMAT